MSLIRVGVAAFPISPNPPSGKFYIGLDSNNANHLTRQDSSGTLTDYEAAATLNINGLTQQNRPSQEVLVPVYDPVLLANRKVRRLELLLSEVDTLHIERSDFIESVTGGITFSSSGSGASNQLGTYGINAIENCRGVTQVDTGTTSTGRAALNSVSTGSLFLDSGDEYRLTWRVAIEALSTVSETFTQYIGFGSMMQSAGMTGQFVGFRYNDALNAGKWECLVVVGGVANDAADSGVTADLNYHKFDIIMTPSAAVFYIDGTQVASLSTGLPSGPSEAFGHGIKIEKSLGTSARNMSADYYSLAYIRSAAR